MRKIVCIVVLLCVLFAGAASASTLSFFPEKASFWKWCDIQVAIMVNSDENIVATDLLIETSLSYKDFIPDTFFPYFFAPKITDNGLIHIVGFSTYHSVSGKGRLWTLVLRSNGTDSDGVIRLYFVGKWKELTFDTNLSAAGGTDTLSSVWNAYYTFTTWTCAPELSWGFGNTAYDDGLQALIHQIDQDGKVNSWDTAFHRAAPEFLQQSPSPSLRSYFPHDTLIYKFIFLCILLLLILVFGIYIIVHKRKSSSPLVPPLLFLLLVLPVLFSVAHGQYYYFDTGANTYQQWCKEPLYIRVTTEASTTGALWWRLHLILNSWQYSYYTWTDMNTMRSTSLFDASTQTFLDWVSTSPTWNGNILQMDRTNISTPYFWSNGLYGTFYFYPLLNQSVGSIFMEYIPGVTTSETTLSRIGWAEIINATQQILYTWITLPFEQKPCVDDTNNPLISFSIPSNGSTKRTPDEGLTFALTEPSGVWWVNVPYVFQWGNFVANPGWIDNQYGIDLSTLVLTLSGNGYTATFLWSTFDTWNSLAPRYAQAQWTTWLEQTKNYTPSMIVSWQLFTYGIEKTITISGTVYDRRWRVFTLSSFSFNNPVWPSLMGGSQNPYASEILVSPVRPITVWVIDDWAGVSGQTLLVIVSGIGYGPYVFSGTDLSLTPVAGVANTPDLLLTINFPASHPMPINTLITVNVQAYDTEWTINQPISYWFTTRPMCTDPLLNCADPVRIYIGTWAPVLYAENQLFISGGNNPYFTGIAGEQTWYIHCGPWIYSWSVALYSGDGQYSWLANFMTDFTWSSLYFSGANDVYAILSGDTLYLHRGIVPPPPPPPGGWGWWGWGGITFPQKDDCRFNPFSVNNLPWSNNLWIDYSQSFYDQRCGEWIHYAPNFCGVEESSYSDELKGAYTFAYQYAMTTMCPIEEATLEKSLHRNHFAKILSNFAIKVLGLVPEVGKKWCNNFNDIDWDTEELKWFMKTACELHLMWLEADGITPKSHFDPSHDVTRAEFWTALSRLLFDGKYNVKSWSLYGEKDFWYKDHLKALATYHIMTKIYDPWPQKVEERWRVMLMLQRVSNSGALKLILPALRWYDALIVKEIMTNK